MKRQNGDLRLMMTACQLEHKAVAARLGIRADSFSRLLARPMSDKRRMEVQRAIESLMLECDRNDVR